MTINGTCLQWLLLQLSRVPGFHAFGMRLLARTLTAEQRREVLVAWQNRNG